MTRYVTRESVIPPGSVVIPQWFVKDLIDAMTRAKTAHEVVARTYPSEVAKDPTNWGSRMGESTMCAVYLSCALDQLQALKEEYEE